MSRTKNNPDKAPRPSRFYHNFRPAMILLLIPVIAGIVAVYFTIGGPLSAQLAGFGSSRLVTENWQTASAHLTASQPEYLFQNAYYRLEAGQNTSWAAQHFSVTEDKLKELNPGNVAYNTTIVVPPVQEPLQPVAATGNAGSITVTEVEGIWHLKNDFRNPRVNTTIPELADLLAAQGVITKIADKHYRINKPLSIDNNIRLDITGATVQKLELASGPNFAITCLCFENSEALIKDTQIRSVDPASGKPDTNHADGRSFVRAYKSTRMDVINSRISYLGNGLLEGRLERPILRQGGTYGVSWKISDTGLGQDITSGWVEGSTFSRNHFGSYTFGASGMMWRNNLFVSNDIYGLDPHDDSNNAVIENNRFIRNGKHGFIVSKRCNYNVIRNNISAENGGHGYMLHEDSNQNVFNDNIAIGNTDNFVIYASDLNTVEQNKSYNPRNSHVRINAGSRQNFISDNLFYGGKHALLLANTDGVMASRNTFALNEDILKTDRVGRVLFANNRVGGLFYKISDNDRVIFGPNQIETKPAIDLKPLSRSY